MEALAFTHAAIAYEDPNPAPELQVNLEIPNSAWVGALSTAVVLSTVVGTAPNAEAVVQFGDFCSAVSDVQASLISEGYDAGGIDSSFGSSTLRAVQRFQSDNGLFADGVVGPQTASALGLSDAAFLVGNSCYYEGDTGSSVGTFVSTNGSALTVRSGPGSSFAAIDYLANGTAVTVTRTSGGWSEISGGGWVSSDWLSTSGGIGGPGGDVGGGGGYYVSTNGGSLIVRSGPGFGYADIDELSNGSYVAIVSTSGGWGQLSGGGWVSMDWLSTSGGIGGDIGGGGDGLLTVSTNGGELVVRSGPGIGYSAVAYLANGSSVPYVDYYGGWYQITNGGWVSADWVS